MDDIKTLKDIRNGKKLSEFDIEITPLMALAALDSRDAYKEIPDTLKNRRFAKMAVNKNFRNVNLVPEKDRIHCGKVFAMWGRQLTRKDLEDYISVLNEQSPAFIKNVIRQDPSLVRFVKKNKKSDTEGHEPKGQDTYMTSVHAVALGTSKKKPASEHFYVDQDEFSSYDFANDEELGSIDELNPEAYLARPVKLQTKEDLDELLTLPDKFPPDFIYRLQMPYKNAAFYEAHQEPDKAAEWKSRQIPWLNRQVCEQIAQMHPEASVKTPAYLKPEYVQNFWDWAKGSEYSKQMLTEYFLLFPPEMLTSDMLSDIEIDWRVLRHVPDMLHGSEQARIYLNKHPNDVFRLPEEYQTLTKLIADGTTLSAATIPQIKNETMRSLIAAAMGLDEDK